MDKMFTNTPYCREIYYASTSRVSKNKISTMGNIGPVIHRKPLFVEEMISDL